MEVEMICDEIARGQFSKITENACLSGWEFEADNSPYDVYATRHWNWMNSYWMFWIGRVRGARSASSICNSKNDLSWFNRIFLLFAVTNSCVFQIFLLRSIKADLCANIINFDSVDFSGGRRPEEVMFLLTLSVFPVLVQLYSCLLLNSGGRGGGTSVMRYTGMSRLAWGGGGHSHTNVLPTRVHHLKWTLNGVTVPPPPPPPPPDRTRTP